MIKDLISHGNYDRAIQIIDSSPSDIEYSILKSRIKELTGHFNEAITIAEQSLVKAKKSKDVNLQISAITAIAYGKWRIADYKGCLTLINEGYDLARNKKTNKDVSTNLANLYNIHGLIYWTRDQLDWALLHFNQGLKLRITAKEPNAISYSLNNIGNTYLSMGDFENALINFNESMNMRIHYDFKPGIAASYNSLGRYYEALREYPSALENYNNSLKIWHEIGNNQFVGKAYRFLGSLYLKLGDVKKAKHNLTYALSFFENIPNDIDSKITQQLFSQV
ncbi:MAG: tetratricopeptide repeat protein [Candidatus Heimdallarchaeota archaeon]|nr:tetratricopeptide repeat protein [Candidatus Heimdallarchaeota archaeon]